MANISEDNLEEGTFMPDTQESEQPDNTGTGEESDPGTGITENGKTEDSETGSADNTDAGTGDNREDSGPVIPDEDISDLQPSLPEETDPDAAQGTGMGVLTGASQYRTVSILFEVPEEWIRNWGDAWIERLLFVVFRDPEGNLAAVPAEYDPQTGLLTFMTDMQGDYVVVCLDPEEIEGELYSDEFYVALEEMEEIRKGLPVIISE